MFTNKIKKCFSALAVAALGVVTLASCGTQEYKVEFMIRDDANVWNVLKEETTVDNKVTLPEAPEKAYYNFSGWFNGEDLKTKFIETGIEKDSKAYAKYVPEEVKIHINDDESVTKNLIDVVNSTYNPGEGLKFDGWYKDSAYAVKWNGKDVVTDLYAQSVAVVTYYNGYEEVHTQFVKPGENIKSPAETDLVINEEETTLEALEIVENYMSPKNIKYVDEKGNEFDFSKPINKNTTITVNWNSVGLESQILKHTRTDDYYLNWASCDESLKNAPVVSVSDEFTVTEKEEQEDGTKKDVEKLVKVDTVRMYSDILPASAEKLILGEGIKLVKGLNGVGASKMKEVSLPSTLKIIDNSFSNMPLLRGIEIPEGVEIVIGSFFTNTVAAQDRYKVIYIGDEYNFDINIPSSVKNLAMVPTNLKFAEGSKFYKEDDRIYTNVEKGKVLISDNKHLKDQTIVVPEGVKGIQTGTYNIQFDFLKLPESFEFVNYNEDVKDYKYYEYMGDSAWSLCDNFLFDSSATKEFNLKMSACAYSISSYLGGNNVMGSKGGAGKVIFPTNKPVVEVPKEGEEPLQPTVKDYMFCGDNTGWAVLTGNYQPMTDATLSSNLYYKDSAVKTFVTMQLPSENLYLKYLTVNAEIESKATTNEAIITALKTSAGENEDLISLIETEIKDKNIVLTNNNTKVEAKDINGMMFITVSAK